MAVAGDDSGIHNYTTKWIETVNQGGLFLINDKSFQLFIAIESIVIQTSYLDTVQHENIKKRTVNACMKNTQVQEKWSVLTKYIDYEKPDDETKLLEEIVKLWVTICGFFLAVTWLETFKQQVKVNTKKKKVYASLLYQSSNISLCTIYRSIGYNKKLYSICITL